MALDIFELPQYNPPQNFMGISHTLFGLYVPSRENFVLPPFGASSVGERRGAA